MTADDVAALDPSVVLALDASVIVRRTGFTLDTRVSIGPGEVVLLTGDNGVGKSTLLRTIAGSLPIDDGRILLDGNVVDDPTADVFVAPERRTIGVVQQDARPFAHLTVLENVAFGLRARGMRRDDAHSRARDQLDRHGLGALADRRGHEVSGGEGRRIVLARALVGRPPLLLLDEPLSSIDSLARAALLEDLAIVTSEHDTALLLVTHDPDEVGTLADRAIELLRSSPAGGSADRLSGTGEGPVR